MVLGVRNPHSIACEVWSFCFPGFCCKSLIISFLYVILFLLFTNDVAICMELDPDIHIGNTWFVLETGCDKSSLVHPVFHVSRRTFLIQHSSGVYQRSCWIAAPFPGVFGKYHRYWSWSHVPSSLVTWEDLEAIKQQFSMVTVWGQPASQGGC
jgi:hypothetical protein